MEVVAEVVFMVMAVMVATAVAAVVVVTGQQPVLVVI